MSDLSFPLKLKELRKTFGYTQDYVASVLGVARQTYSHYEVGSRVPNSTALYKLAGLYSVSVDDLMRLLSADTFNEVTASDSTLPKPDSGLSDFLEYFNAPYNLRKYKFFNNDEKQLLYYYEKISSRDRKLLVEFAKVMACKE